MDIKNKDKQINCVTVQGALHYFIENYGIDELHKLLEPLNLSYSFVSDRENWLTWHEYVTIIESITTYQGDPHEAMEAIGRCSLDKNLIGNIWYLLFSNFISFKITLKNAVKYREQYNRTAMWEILELTENKFVVKIKWKSGLKTTPLACLHRRTVISKAPELWGNKPAIVREIQCQTDGHDCCIDEYRWTNSSKKITTYTLTPITLFVLYLSDMFNPDSIGLAISILIIAVLIGLRIDDKRKIKIHGDNNQDQVEQLCDAMNKLESKYDELQSVNTELNKAYDELYEARKLQPLGILAGSIAHDYNNILTGIMGHLQFFKISLESGEKTDKILQDLDEINQATEQARSLTNRLLVFSKQGSPITQVLSIDELLKENTRFALTGTNIEPHFNIDDDIWPVDVDRYQFGQVITNLSINSAQAMPQGGHVFVSAHNTTVNSNTPSKLKPIKPGEYVLIEFRDEGIGIPKEHLEKIFDPYFTTKEGGSGLGLASSHNIIKKHGGYIQAKSSLNEGTVFHIYMPKSDKNIIRTYSSFERPLFGKGKVLVLDDDPTIRKILNGMLKYLGYQVDTTRKGSETIASYKSALQSDSPYDAVILDLTLSGTKGGGQAIMAELLSIDPKVKAIVSSGYSHEPVMAEYKKYGFKYAMRKPYTLTELSNVIYDTVTEEVIE